MNVDFKKSYDEYVVKAKVLFPDTTFWSWEKLPADIRAAWERMHTPRELEANMKPLSREANKKIAERSREIIQEAMRNERLKVNVFEAPEVYHARVDRVIAGIVNYALNVAHEEWNAPQVELEGCAYCLQYEHGMKPANAVTCTCMYHCGAMFCPEAKLVDRDLA